MIRLSEPEYSYEQAIEACVKGITGNIDLRKRLTSCKKELIAIGGDYVRNAEAGSLYAITPISSDEDDPDVMISLKKSDLIKVYEQYFVSENKPGRLIYNALLNAAKEKCPFCGGIGTPHNLDHFLPKTYFPQYSVFLRNLVPACRDCNMDGKKQSFARSEGDQIIQPYVDKDKYFTEQWIYANYRTGDSGDPGEFEYYCFPPKEWSEVEKQRAVKHFEVFDLAKRYSVRAAELLVTVLKQIESLERVGLDKSNIRSSFLQSGADMAPFVNHWQKGMYQALMVVMS